MKIEERDGGKTQFVILDSITECFRLVLEPTGKNCRDEVNANLARLHLGESVDRAREAVQKFMAPTSSLDKYVAKAKSMIEGMLDDLGVRRSRPTRKMRHRLESGDEMDPQSYLTRRLDAWSEVRHERRPHRAIKIAINVSMASAYVADGVGISRGAMMAAMSDILEEIGYSIEITLYDVTRAAGNLCNTYVVEIPIKSMAAPLDVNQIAYLGSNSDFIQDVVFPIQARVLRGKSEHWGRPGAVPAWIAKTQDILIDEVHTLDAAAKLVKSFADRLK